MRDLGRVDVHEATNTSCGDTVKVYCSPALGRGKEPEPFRLWVRAEGCAICRAGGELANHLAASRSPAELAHIADALVTAFATGVAAGLPEDCAAFLVLREVHGRRRCATLPWEAVQRALRGLH